MSLAENSLLSGYRLDGLLRRGLMSLAAMHAFARRIVARFQVIARDSHAQAKSLSGGNLQKFIIGRELLQQPRQLVAAHPTWGVDAGAAQAIRQALVDLARGGAAVLIVSHDLDELFEISDRLAVISAGRLSAARTARDMTVEQAGLLMGGAGATEPGSEGSHAA